MCLTQRPPSRRGSLRELWVAWLQVREHNSRVPEALQTNITEITPTAAQINPQKTLI